MRAGELLDGRYRLVRELGRGGFGVVWEAYDGKVGRPVAVKVISEQNATDEREVRRFVAEARTVGGLSHPHIVTLYDLGEVADGGFATHYLVMELVRGRPLSAVLKDGAPDPGQALEWVREVCGALDAAHRAGVVHRDIKPENVMITDDGEAKVLDFGIARLMSHTSGLTSTGSVIGSPPYLAPERWAGAKVDGRADLYSLGVVLYQLCTGRRPFTGPSPVEYMRQHVQEPPPPLRTADPALTALVLDLLAKDPADRPADAAEVRRRLRDLGTPAPPPPPGPSPEQLRRRADRAWQLGADGNPAEAVAVLEGLVPQLARLHGPDDVRTLRTCHDLALWRARGGDPGAAAALLRELVPRLAGLPGARADVLRDLAHWEAEAGRGGPNGAAAPALAALLAGGGGGLQRG
ncbi:serine/threonine-protein kinase [Kitasatospora sp. NPDC054939]